MARFKLYIITAITLALGLIIYFTTSLQKQLQIGSMLTKQSTEFIGAKIISADIFGRIKDKKPLQAQVYEVTITRITLNIIKDFARYRNEEFLYFAENIKGSGWIDEKNKSLGYELNFHNSAFLLENLNQKDEIKNLSTTGDIKIKVFLQEEDNIFKGIPFNMPMVISLNNFERAEVANVLFSKNDNGYTIYGEIDINLSDYGITPPKTPKVFEYEDKIKITFEANAAKSD